MSELDGINQHLEELRKRLLRIVLVVGIITALILTFHAEPFQLAEITLYYPTPEPLNNIAAQITDHMKENLVPKDKVTDLFWVQNHWFNELVEKPNGKTELVPRSLEDRAHMGMTPELLRDTLLRDPPDNCSACHF